MSTELNLYFFCADAFAVSQDSVSVRRVVCFFFNKKSRKTPKICKALRLVSLRRYWARWEFLVIRSFDIRKTNLNDVIAYVYPAEREKCRYLNRSIKITGTHCA